ncbi:MAG: Membrane protein involved in the export of O-antigen and teichoic acid [Candidatus Woesebacteria bacterium GW2011_GWA1_33_30]|uniref:Membrane protein involved in the export of O-antigen and teichoic acid n=1 Tax=Candidatus Woesebacteria bacterium GW2011_GWA2_33_28 TaxID=1618561 RepID=A0A0G0CTZ1_9BACT|nr:MAG: Membrane protein involved in the export of O-antigen and teichoic acid [Candidatus Woesebacteria bacterium GW2011_GWA2_33_28]KKP47584.1 MAG: Membrane protein involved in the export of O-antigen and teichoic acid [Candidatus Woesebacteria bacterium GW2011_GWA1_33_30]KKP49205.1 MAG: Membrane protein involved in the export of O-antigen and teichoic acid [Microgenomates group bacterium GW2011_GWC1_33_32]KKP51697.1 MAG: Membrane protein involved in the export of O-antigen and teichoic acid [C
MNLKSSLIWTGSLRAVTRSLLILKTLILARILTPAQFGIFGIASLALGFLETVTETGVNVILIQEKKNISHYINTGWVVSIVRGFLISLIIIGISPLITIFFDSSESLFSLRLISLIPIIRGFINPAVVSYQKNLKFNSEFKFRGSLVFFEVLTTVLFGLVLRSEIAFVLGMIVASLLEVVLSFATISLRPKLEFNFKKLKILMFLGKWITFAKIFDYLFSHGDDIVVGKLLGVYPLGIYQQAYKISTLPITEISETFQKVTFPLYSKMVTQNISVKRIYFKTIITTSLIVIPFGIILYLFPKEIVILLLGKNWLEVIPVLQVLAIFGVIKTIANSSFPLLLAFKRQDLVMALTLIGILGLGFTIYPLVSIYGLVGVGISTIIGSLVMIPPAFYWINRYIND